jgi:hypothetical protein
MGLLAKRQCLPMPRKNLDACDEALSLLSPFFLLPSMHLVLYQRDDCHLCDLALDVLAQARVPDFTSVFIDDDADLEARYGDRVPVLRDQESARELSWPFDAQAVAGWLAA